MGLIAKFFKKRASDATDQPTSRLDLMAGSQTRKEIIAMAVRDALKKHGVPPGTVTSEALASNAHGRLGGVHVLLFFREWNPALLPYLVSLEHAMLSRLSRLDPMSRTWLAGVSWRFEPREPSRWPKLAPAGQWTAAKIAPQRVQQNTRKDLEALLEKGDLSRPAADFSPTLPMQHVTQ